MLPAPQRPQFFSHYAPGKTVPFSEHIMSTDESGSTFLCQMEAIVYVCNREKANQNCRFQAEYAYCIVFYYRNWHDYFELDFTWCWSSSLYSGLISSAVSVRFSLDSMSVSVCMTLLCFQSQDQNLSI